MHPKPIGYTDPLDGKNETANTPPPSPSIHLLIVYGQQRYTGPCNFL
ncbi:hypothetical protein [Pasteuria penetrans]|nr:hypothetical protein [Pasteuria penetrans]